MQIRTDNKYSIFTMKKNILVLATLGSLMLASCGNTPEQVVEEYYGAVQSNDFAKALSISNISKEEQALVAEILDSSHVVVHDYKVLGSTIDPGDSTATVDLHLVTSHALHPDSIADDIKVPCVKKGHKWVVKML